MSHRLELVIKHAFEKLIVMDSEPNTKIVSEYLDKTINKVYTFYNAQGYKRATHLKQTCAANNHQVYSLSKIIEIRWIAFDYKAMKALHSMWSIIIIDLHEIANDRSFLQKTRDKAQNLRTILSGKYFLLLFHFLFDIVNELSVLSLEMQKRSALIVDFHSFKSKFESIFSKFKTDNGRYFKDFLNEARCQNEIDDDLDRCGTISEYLQSSRITYKNVILIDDANEIPEVNEYRNQLLDNLLREFKKYFSDGDSKNFDAFDPNNMPLPNDFAA